MYPGSVNDSTDRSTSYNDYDRHAFGQVGQHAHASHQPPHLSSSNFYLLPANYPQEVQDLGGAYSGFNFPVAGYPAGQNYPQSSSFNAPPSSLRLDDPTSLSNMNPQGFSRGWISGSNRFEGYDRMGQRFSQMPSFDVPSGSPHNPTSSFIPSSMTAHGSSRHQMYGNYPAVVPSNPVPPHSPQHLPLAPGLQEILAQLLFYQSTRPQVSYIPDCPVPLQKNFDPHGLLWAYSFKCRFRGCAYTVNRAATDSYTDYVRLVWDHLKAHAKAMPKGGRHTSCGWERCDLTTRSPQGLQLKETRDKMRHIVTHLPWYTLCTKCGKLFARDDSKGTNHDRCLTGKCLPQGNFAERIRLAYQTAPGYFGPNFTISSYFDIVLRG